MLQAMPGIGKIRATQIMEKLKIADSRRLRGLGDQQRKALLRESCAAELTVTLGSSCTKQSSEHG